MTRMRESRFRRFVTQVFVFVMFFITGLALSRLLYEGLFPRLLWLARPVPVIVLALLTAAAGFLCWRWLNSRIRTRSDQSAFMPLSAWVLAPLLFNLPYLLDPAVDLVNSRLLLAVSIWLTALMVVACLLTGRNWGWIGVLFILAAVLPIYLVTVPQTVGSADTFEFQVVIPQLGIAHPTGYPLYILLGRLFAFIPLGTVAWRVNLASVFFATLAAIIFYDAARRLIKRQVPSVLATVSLALVPIFWSQAVIAEVYALHAALFTAWLWLIGLLLGDRVGEREYTAYLLNWSVKVSWQNLIIALFFVVGLGLANHLTSVFLLPAVVLILFYTYGSCLRRSTARANLALSLKILAAFLLPLLLYAYLPIRWYAIHGQSMGLERFVDWIVGGRFQGALQFTAWLTDMTRYEVIGRLILQNWGWVNLVLVVVGLVYLVRLNWRITLILFITWLGFIFYALNYYVPDLGVFIIPAHVMMALFWGAGVTAMLVGSEWLLGKGKWSSLIAPVGYILLLLVILPSISRAMTTWPKIKENTDVDFLYWGRGVLEMPLEDEAAILADSEKIAPLYYLQQAEGERPDLEIMVLPDETAYRAELDRRIALGQSVYLARFLPGLESIYHLRSTGPLVEVSLQPLLSLPEGIERRQLNFNSLNLTGISFQERSAFDPDASSATLFWQSESPLTESIYIYLRWAGADFVTDPLVKSGELPAGNTYPTVAWRPGEIVSDFHLLPRPLSDVEQQLDLQVAVAPSFTPAEDLIWQTVKKVELPSASERLLARGMRAQNGRILLSGFQFPPDIRPQTALPLILAGYGDQVRDLKLSLHPIEAELPNSTDRTAPSPLEMVKTPFTYAAELDLDLRNGRYYLYSQDPRAASICGWLAPRTDGCILGEVNISGIALPDGATNYDNKIALLNVDLPETRLQPGGKLSVDLRWQSLSAVDEDYTVFIQVLDAQDQIVGQVDAWPVQGTYPTSLWKPGEIVNDPHIVQLSGDFAPGQYKLQIGWYLLSTLGRLPVVDDMGQARDDKLTITDLVAP